MTPLQLSTRVQQCAVHWWRPPSPAEFTLSRWVLRSSAPPAVVTPTAPCASLRHSRIISVAASGRSSSAVFFVDSSEGFKLTLEPQQLLGLPAHELCKDSVVNQAHDDLLKVPLEPGYSAGLAAGRAEVLALARTSAFANKGKPTEKRARDINVPYDLLPACLALLAELNDNDMVLQLGAALLGSGELDSYQVVKSDVLLSMALAKCNLAREAFSNSQQVTVGCQLLEEALHLLQPKGGPLVAPELAKEVRNSLSDLHSQCALEQVAAPLTKERAEERKRAVRTVREMLRLTGVDRVGAATAQTGTGGGRAPVVNQEFVSRLMAQLTCDEVVHLHDWELIAKHSTSYKWVYPGLLERVTAGHVLLGFQQCAPAYIRMALQLIKHLPARGAEVLVMQGICHLLLGSVHVAIELLQQAEAAGQRAQRGPGSAPESGPLTGDLVLASPMWGAQAYAYVRDNTPSSDDGLLPGLCLYAQLWLSKVAVPQFRDTAASPLPALLSRYFDNTRVEAIITVYDEKGEVGRASQAQNGLQDVLAGLREGLGQLQEAARSSLAGVAGTTSGKDVVHTLSSAARGGSLGHKVERAGALLASALGSMRSATVEQFGRLSKQQLALMLGMVGLAALMLWPKGRGTAGAQHRPSDPAIATSAAVVHGSAATQSSGKRQPAAPAADAASTQLQSRTVEQVLKMWQETKAQALGPSYESSGLPDVLAEPVLTDMKLKVAKFRAEGWYMRYKLHRLKVKEIDNSMVSAGRAVVRATLDESAALYDVDGRQADSYKSTYEAEYELAQSKDGSWKVAQVVVVGQDDHL